MISKDLLINSQECSIKSFGDENPDRVFFVIRQGVLGRGLFSLLSSVICYMHFAETHGFTPVVDFKNFKTEYNEPNDICGTQNAFEYYFEPVSQFTLDEVYRSKNVVISSNSYPAGYDYTIGNIPNLQGLFGKYIKIRDDIEGLVNIDRFIEQGKVLGVHFRGQEFRTAPGHWFPPTPQQMYKAIDLMLAKASFKYIFVSTEDQRLLDLIVKRYPKMVISNDHFRTAGANAYKIYPRELHKYLLGKEILIDMLTLSRCSALIHCTSNVSWMARYANNQKYDYVTFIDNGPNSLNRLVAKVLWRARYYLPSKWGGFNNSDEFLKPVSLINIH